MAFFDECISQLDTVPGTHALDQSCDAIDVAKLQDEDDSEKWMWTKTRMQMALTSALRGICIDDNSTSAKDYGAPIPIDDLVLRIALKCGQYFELHLATPGTCSY